MELHPYKALIIGAGMIGALYDNPNSEAVLTHAHALSLHAGFELMGFVDTDLKKAREAAAIWGGEADTKAEPFIRAGAQVVCLASPDMTHFDYLKELSTSKAALIFAEKPITTTWDEAKQLRSLYDSNPSIIAVNFSRRFIPDYQDLRREIQANLWGEFIGGNVFYGKGLAHNGSHALDLLRFLLGDFSECRNLAVINDYNDKDPSTSFWLKNAAGKQVVVMAIDQRAFTIFEIDLMFMEGRIRIIDSGSCIEIYQVMDNPQFAGYRRLVLEQTRKVAISKIMYYAVDHLYQVLLGKVDLICTMEDGIKVMEMVARIRGEYS